VTEIQGVLHAFPPPATCWLPPVVRTSVSDADSVAELSAAIDRHQSWLNAHNNAAQRQLQRQRYRLRSLLERQLAEMVSALGPDFFQASLHQQVQTLAKSLQVGFGSLSPLKP